MVKRKRQVCMYDGKCYRKNSKHFEEFDHPIQRPDKKQKEKDVKENENAKLFPQLSEEVECGFIQLREPYTKVEIKMFSLVQAILYKSDWFNKLNDEEIKKKWIEEAQVQQFEDSMIEYMFDKLKHEISETKDIGTIASPFHSIFQSDTLINDSLKKKLLKQVVELEKLPKDYHPFSNNLVLDLIHPSLYCLVGDVTPISKEKIEQRNVPISLWLKESTPMTIPKVEVPPPEEFYQEYVEELHPDYITLTKTNFISDKFQWLPSDISVSKEGKVQFESYINNLHPLKFKELYSCLEQILEKFIPMFELVLGNNGGEIISSIYHNALYDDGFDQKFGDDYEDYLDNYDEEELQAKGSFFNEKYQPRKLNSMKLKGRNLQVIVKMANIELTPDSPSYEGGSWHMEGMENEKIVATGIYYYEKENISQSVLSFRQAVAQPEDQGQDFGQIFGYGFESELNQEIGSINAIEDRCIAFPNYYQHLVQPFELKDKSKNGHRKILVFFLIDPNYDIVSTRRVFPQQKDWILPAYETVFQSILPKEVVEIIVGFSSDSMSEQQAKDYRLELMDERKKVVEEQDGTVFNRPCSLCEH
eukprot:gene8473-295_t